MKRILSTSALTILMASGAAYAQQSNQSGTIFANVPNDPSMLLGTDYIGQTVYSTLGNNAEVSAEQATTETTTTTTTEEVATSGGEIIPEPDTTGQDVDATAPAPATEQEMTADQQPQSVGQISDIIMTQDGQLEYVVLGVGGFLGIGEQNVAVNFDALSVQPDPQNEGEYMIMISATQEQIENAPEFDPSLVEGTAQSAQTGTVNTEANTQVETTESTTQSDANVEVETTTESSSDMETIEPETTTVENAGEEAAGETEQAVEGAANQTEQAVEGAAQETGQAVEGAANNTEQAVENAGESVSNAAGEAASEAGQAVEQTGDAIENATDEATTSN